ncbi:anti-sigma factor family protein [Streptomyces sp. NPDC048370]|uniref:anti-sigma factor family protein n=1 Tax=Streptomyces sp. NPDC048370 TaxID=3365540 RepID=UPI00371F4507
MSPAGPTPAEQHLGDRLAALVDGELGHDARERVLAHLATCAKCKAEADAQRRLKSVFASTAPPPPSEGLLARLQGLPGGPGEPGGDDRRGPFDDLFGLGGGGGVGGGIGGVRSDGFATAVPVSPHHSGFRIHAVGRPDGDRSSWRGRRFGIAAASAVSFAAIALGGALPLEATPNVGARGEGTGTNVTPLRTSATGPGVGSVTGTGTGSGTGTATNAGTTAGRGGRTEERTSIGSSESPIGVGSTTGTVASGPLVPGEPTPAVALQLQGTSGQSVFELSPFVRPTGPALRLAFTSAYNPLGGPRPAPSPTALADANPTTTPLTSHR